MKKVLLMFIALSLLFVTILLPTSKMVSANSTLPLDTNFESGSVGGWALNDATKATVSIVNDPVLGASNKVLKFERTQASGAGWIDYNLPIAQAGKFILQYRTYVTTTNYKQFPNLLGSGMVVQGWSLGSDQQ